MCSGKSGARWRFHTMSDEIFKDHVADAARAAVTLDHIHLVRLPSVDIFVCDSPASRISMACGVVGGNCPVDSRDVGTRAERAHGGTS